MNSPRFKDTDFWLDIGQVSIGPEIGKGQFSVVYLGKYFGDLVAVKKQSRNQVSLEQYLLRELAVLKIAKHENLVSYLGAHNEETPDKYGKCSLYIVTELYQGGDLLKVLLNKSIDLGWKLRTRIANQTANAINFLHNKNLIHRDIKTSNILLDERWNCKISDFGMARETNYNQSSDSDADKNKRMTLCGTNEYMAPEILFEENYSFGVDIFCFGMVLFEIIFRQQVGTGGFIVRTPQTLFTIDYDQLRQQLPPETVESMFSLAIHCTNTEQNDRPTSEEVVEWIDDLYDHLPEDRQIPPVIPSVILAVLNQTSHKQSPQEVSNHLLQSPYQFGVNDEYKSSSSPILISSLKDEFFYSKSTPEQSIHRNRSSPPILIMTDQLTQNYFSSIQHEIVWKPITTNQMEEENDLLSKPEKPSTLHMLFRPRNFKASTDMNQFDVDDPTSASASTSVHNITFHNSMKSYPQMSEDLYQKYYLVEQEVAQFNSSHPLNATELLPNVLGTTTPVASHPAPTHRSSFKAIAMLASATFTKHTSLNQQSSHQSQSASTHELDNNDFSAVIKTGYLYKRNETGFRNWKKMWCTLTESKFCWKSHQESSGKRSCFNLRDCSIKKTFNNRWYMIEMIDTDSELFDGSATHQMGSNSITPRTSPLTIAIPSAGTVNNLVSNHGVGGLTSTLQHPQSQSLPHVSHVQFYNQIIQSASTIGGHSSVTNNFQTISAGSHPHHHNTQSTSNGSVNGSLNLNHTLPSAITFQREFAAQSPMEMEEWVQAIQEAIDIANDDDIRKSDGTVNFFNTYNSHSSEVKLQYNMDVGLVTDNEYIQSITTNSRYNKLQSIEQFPSVISWLTDLGIPSDFAQKYEQIFIAKGYGNTAIIAKLGLNEKDLEYLGISNPLHSRLLLCSIKPTYSDGIRLGITSWTKFDSIIVFKTVSRWQYQRSSVYFRYAHFKKFDRYLKKEIQNNFLESGSSLLSRIPSLPNFDLVDHPLTSNSTTPKSSSKHSIDTEVNNMRKIKLEYYLLSLASAIDEIPRLFYLLLQFLELVPHPHR